MADEIPPVPPVPLVAATFFVGGGRAPISLHDGVDHLGRRNVAATSAPLYGAERDVEHPTSIRQAILGIVHHNLVVAASVLVLPASRKPVAILGRIAERVVSSFDGVPLRHLTHIGKKVLERVLPPLADRDAATAIVRKSRDVRIRASVPHVEPTRVFYAMPAPMRATSVPRVAPATLRPARVQSVGSDDRFLSAIAAASVQNSAARMTTVHADDEQPHVPFAGLVLKYCHVGILSNLAHQT